MNITDVMNAIMTGELDDNEQLIYDAFKARRKAKRETTKLVNKAMMGDGDTIKITAKMSPTVLTGLVGKITSIAGTKVSIETDAPFFMRNRMQSNVTVPIDCVTLVAKKSADADTDAA